MSIGATGSQGTRGVGGVEPTSEPEEKPKVDGPTTPPPEAGPPSTAVTTARPRSMDMVGIALRAELEARLAASSGTTTPEAPPKTDAPRTDAPKVNPTATGTPTVPAEPKKEPLGGWKVSASFGPRFEKYDPVDVRIKNDKVDVTVEGAHFLQRNSMEYYKFWEAEKVGDVFRWIDEPTNQTKIEAQKADYLVGIRAYHPKMLVSLGGDGKPNLNTNVHVKGTIEGKPVDQNMNLSDKFGAIRLTHKFMNFEAYGGKSFTLAEGKKGGKLTLDATAGVGIYTGRVAVAYRDPKDYWNFIDYNEEKSKVVGGSVTLSNTLTYMLSGGRVGIGAEADITRGKLKYDMMGGTTSHDVKSQSFAVFVKMNF